MKKSFNAAILATTLAIALTACSNPAAPENPSSSSSANDNRGTAPVLTQAFISETTNISRADFNWNNLVLNTTHDMYYYRRGLIIPLEIIFIICVLIVQIQIVM